MSTRRFHLHPRPCRTATPRLTGRLRQSARGAWWRKPFQFPKGLTESIICTNSTSDCASASSSSPSPVAPRQLECSTPVGRQSPCSMRFQQQVEHLAFARLPRQSSVQTIEQHGLPAVVGVDGHRFANRFFQLRRRERLSKKCTAPDRIACTAVATVALLREHDGRQRGWRASTRSNSSPRSSLAAALPRPDNRPARGRRRQETPPPCSAVPPATAWRRRSPIRPSGRPYRHRRRTPPFHWPPGGSLWFRPMRFAPRARAGVPQYARADSNCRPTVSDLSLYPLSYRRDNIRWPILPRSKAFQAPSALSPLPRVTPPTPGRGAGVQRGRIEGSTGDHRVHLHCTVGALMWHLLINAFSRFIKCTSARLAGSRERCEAPENFDAIDKGNKVNYVPRNCLNRTARTSPARRPCNCGIASIRSNTSRSRTENRRPIPGNVLSNSGEENTC